MYTTVKEWIAEQLPGSFLDVAPDVIFVHSREYVWINGYKLVNAAGHMEWRNEYQATTPNCAGEFPLFETVVTEIRRGKTARYTFDNSPVTGTGIK